MAEGWAHTLLAGFAKPYSAGIVSHGINQRAVQVMAEADIDISMQKSQTLDEMEGMHFDLVITLCDHAHEVCPIFPAATHVLHVGFPDPPKMAEAVKASGGSEEQQLNCYRQVRDEIKVFLQELAESFSQ